MIQGVLTVFRKEVVDNFKDRRTLFSSLLFGPLFGHALIPAAVEREFLAGQPVGTSFFEARAAGLIQVTELEVLLDTLLKGLLTDKYQ